jgi:glucuronosyltransferase
MRVFWLCLALTLIVSFQPCDSAKILALFPCPGRSQIMIMQALAKELAVQGHQVTMVSPYPLDKPLKNYRDVKVDLVNRHES